MTAHGRPTLSAYLSWKSMFMRADSPLSRRPDCGSTMRMSRASGFARYSVLLVLPTSCQEASTRDMRPSLYQMAGSVAGSPKSDEAARRGAAQLDDSPTARALRRAGRAHENQRSIDRARTVARRL